MWDRWKKFLLFVFALSAEKRIAANNGSNCVKKFANWLHYDSYTMQLIKVYGSSFTLLSTGERNRQSTLNVWIVNATDFTSVLFQFNFTDVFLSLSLHLSPCQTFGVSKLWIAMRNGFSFEEHLLSNHVYVGNQKHGNGLFVVFFFCLPMARITKYYDSKWFY